MIATAWATLWLTGCQTENVRHDDSGQAAEGSSADIREFKDATAGGGRWSAALEASDDPRTVYLLDQHTDWVYEIGGDAPVTIERLEWLEEDQLAIHGGDSTLLLQILPPEPNTNEGHPRFVVRPAEIRFTTSQGRGASLTEGSIYTMKNRLKRESYRRRGPRIPANN